MRESSEEEQNKTVRGGGGNIVCDTSGGIKGPVKRDCHSLTHQPKSQRAHRKHLETWGSVQKTWKVIGWTTC